MQYDKVLDSRCLGILSAIFNDMSGRLFTVIREQHNLVYGVHFNTGACTEGTIGWTVNLGLDMQNVSKAYDLIKEELSRPITNEEIDWAIPKAIGRSELARDNHQSIVCIVVAALLGGVDYKRSLDEYRQQYENARVVVKDFQHKMEFHKNLIVGVLPKK
jgi:predicted Zn-dependent peptidase